MPLFSPAGSTHLTESPKVCLISLGCPKNLVDAEMMLGYLKKDGFAFTREPSEAEVVVVNTCGFLESSKRESIGEILKVARYKEKGRCRVLMATGCLPQRHGEELAREMPEVDLFVGTGEFDRIAGFLRGKFSERVCVSKKQILPDPDLPRVLATPPHYTYVKISEGCSHTCSFCIIPAIRGGLKSRPMDSVVREVAQHVDLGVKEFNFIAQDLNEYGRDLKNGSNLTRLLQELDRIQGKFWIRLLYMYPLEFNDRLIGAIRDAEHVVKYVDMPLQHINERILLSMRRGSPSRYVRQLLGKLKKAMPDITLRTTFIVGYPGEMEEEFQELCDFVGEVEFDRVGVFQYSREEGTTAALLSDDVSQEIKKERYDRLMGLQQKVSHHKNKSLIGKTLGALSEGVSGKPGIFQARLASQAPEIDGVTWIHTPDVPVGQFVTLRVTAAHEYDLEAVITQDLLKIS